MRRTSLRHPAHPAVPTCAVPPNQALPASVCAAQASPVRPPAQLRRAMSAGPPPHANVQHLPALTRQRTRVPNLETGPSAQGWRQLTRTASASPTPLLSDQQAPAWTMMMTRAPVLAPGPGAPGWRLSIQTVTRTTRTARQCLNTKLRLPPGLQQRTPARMIRCAHGQNGISGTAALGTLKIAQGPVNSSCLLCAYRREDPMHCSWLWERLGYVMSCCS